MYLLLFLVGIYLVGTEAAGDFECEGKDTIAKEVFSTSCGKSISVTSPVAVIASEHIYKVLPNCMNCSLTFAADEGNQLIATFHTFGTEVMPGGNCSKNRVDVYNSAVWEEDQLLSNASGLCGCNLPGKAFKSSENFLTLGFITVCNNSTVQHGEFEIIISTFKKDKIANISSCAGQFECLDGTCINKTLVCNGKSDCKDNSDETGCKKKPEPKLTPLWLFILIGVSGLCLILLFVIMILLCYRYCCQSKMAAAYERFK